MDIRGSVNASIQTVLAQRRRPARGTDHILLLLLLLGGGVKGTPLSNVPLNLRRRLPSFRLPDTSLGAPASLMSLSV